MMGVGKPGDRIYNLSPLALLNNLPKLRDCQTEQGVLSQQNVLAVS